MPSSTSSSEPHTPPAGPWGRTCLLAAVLVVSVLGGRELLWRSHGFQPRVTDDRDLWSQYRDQLRTGRRDVIALLGTSRIQVGFDAPAFRQAYPDYQVVQLALSARFPLVTLYDLADDELFAGVAICDLTEIGVTPEHRNDQQGYVDYYHQQWNLQKKIERRINTYLQERLVILNPDLASRSVFSGLFGHWPKQPFITNYPDRTQRADYSRVKDLNRRAARWVQEAPAHTPVLAAAEGDVWQRAVAELDRNVKKIQARGGEVVLVRYVTSGELYKLQSHQAPREKYWQVLADNTSAQTIHFEDVPALRSLTCPEDSHLDAREATVFTLKLGEELERRGVIKRGTEPALRKD